jgi:hypothetical protein
MKTNIITSGASSQDFLFIDEIINIETKRKINKVKEAKDFGIMTACQIDGEFVLVSDYTVPQELALELEKA